MSPSRRLALTTSTESHMSDLSAEFKALANYRPTHKVRFVTAASLFDGHDAAINIMRRILQGISISSYQG